jgi:hypothetical protein
MGSHRCRWEDNIKMDLREIRINGGKWIGLAQVGSSGRLL